MRTIIALFLMILLFTGIIILAESKPKIDQKPECPYLEKMHESKVEQKGECPYSGNKEQKQNSGVCPYSGKSLHNSAQPDLKFHEQELYKSKQLLDRKLKIVFT